MRVGESEPAAGPLKREWSRERTWKARKTVSRDRQVGFGRSDADIRGIIPLDVGRVRPDDHGNHQRLAVNRVAGDH